MSAFGERPRRTSAGSATFATSDVLTSGELQTVASPIALTECASSLWDIAIAASTCTREGRARSGSGKGAHGGGKGARALEGRQRREHLQPHLHEQLDAARAALRLGEHQLAEERRRAL